MMLVDSPRMKSQRDAMSAQPDWSTGVKSEPETVKANLIAQLKWAKNALDSHRTGQNASETYFSEGMMDGGIIALEAFRLYPDGTVEKRSERPTDKWINTMKIGEVALEIHYALMSPDGRLSFGQDTELALKSRYTTDGYKYKTTPPGNPPTSRFKHELN